MRFEPGIDPEGLDSDYFFLFVGHRSRNVHHVDNGGDGLRLRHIFPGPVLLVLTDGNDLGIARHIGSGADLALERALERSLEMPQTLRAHLADRGIAISLGADILSAARLDARQLEFFAQNGGQFFEREFDFEDVSAGLIAGLAAVVALRRTERSANIAVAGADAAGAFLAELELRDFDLRQGDRNEIAPLLPDHLAAADVFAEVAFHLAADKLAEALMIAFDFLAHGFPLSGSSANDHAL